MNEIEISDIQERSDGKISITFCNEFSDDFLTLTVSKKVINDIHLYFTEKLSYRAQIAKGKYENPLK